MDKKILISVGIAVTITVIILILVMTTKLKIINSPIKSKEKEKYITNEFPKMTLFVPNTDKSAEIASSLLQWWFGFISKMNPKIVDSIYLTCTFLQSIQGMELRGLQINSKYAPSEQFIATLSLLKDKLENVNPESIKTVNDVNKYFSVCIDILNEQAGIVSKSGLYNDVPKGFQFTNVY